jgi:potassium-transporting ATPase KdpC subunit
MRSEIRPAVMLFLVLTLITGVIYPAVVTAIAKSAFPRQAAGSMIERHGKPIGSELIGQPFTDPKYFWSRPSATTDADSKPLPYNAQSSGGSNLAPSNPALVDAVKARIAALRAADPGNDSAVPVDLVTSSGSGLDPHISIAAARYQTARVARARNITPAAVESMVPSCTEGRTFGFLGEPRVNVLKLNLALDGGH